MKPPTPDPVRLERLRRICLALPEAREVQSFGHPAFRAGRRDFAVWEHHRGTWCVCVRARAETPGAPSAVPPGPPGSFVPPYGRAGGWVALSVGGRDDWRQVRTLVVSSYRQVALRRMLAALDPADPPLAGRPPQRRRS